MITFTVPGQPVAKGRGHKKASDQQVRDAFADHRSCRKAAESLGMSPQAFHERLVRLGENIRQNVFTEEDATKLRREYSSHAENGTLGKLAASMGRTKQFICRKASELGLTDKNRPRPYASEKLSVIAKERIAKNGHPRGMAGKKHTRETLEVLSEISKTRWAALSEDQRAEINMRQLKSRAAGAGSAAPRKNTTWKAGWREVGGQRCYFRSRWEANYARYLEWLRNSGNIKSWEHEPETFWFEKIKRGCRSYLPDFKVTETDGSIIYHEVKGWMDDRSQTKIKRMRIYHPAVKLLVIDSKAYRSIEKKAKLLVHGWETDTAPRVIVTVRELEGEPA